jgi:hypothetical protein
MIRIVDSTTMGGESIKSGKAPAKPFGRAN